MRRAVLAYGPVLALVAGAVLVVVVILSKVAGDSGKYVAFAKLDDAGGVLKNYTVKVGNVTAGSVEAVSLDKRDDVVVRMELDSGVAPIGAGASAKVRPVNLLGEKYIDLDVGDQSKPLPSGSTIPKERTSTPTELDDLLNALDPKTRAGLRIMINEAGQALAGRGADFNAVLEELPPALDEAREFLTEVVAENATLERLIVRGDRVVASMHGRRDELGNLVASAADAFDVVADRRKELGATVRTAPAAFSQLTGTLGRIRGAADKLTPAARSLRETAPALATTLARAPAFARDAKAALETARDVAPALSRLGRQSTPTLTRLRPTVDRLADFSAGSQKLLDAADQRRGLREFLDFMQGWVGVITNADGLGHVFRLRLTFDDEFFTSAVSRYLDVFGPKKKASARRPSGRAVKPDVKQLLRTPAPGVKQLGDRLKQTVDGVTRGVTKEVQRLPERLKETTDQATPLLDFLLGS